MKGAVILACAIAVVLGNDAAYIELNEVGCPINKAIEMLYPHPDCNKFYQCSNGELIELECSINLWFDAEKLQCDWSYKVDCGSRNITDTKPEEKTSTEKVSDEDVNNGTCNCDPTEAPEICAQADSDGVLIAHEYCNHFYKCSNQVPVDFRCPEFLLYNPYKEFCDWYGNVDCGNKTISEYEEITTTSGEDDVVTIEPVDNYPVDAEERCAQEGSNGTLVSHDYCNWFYSCVDYQPIPQKCPGNLLFNPELELCDWPERVKCINKTTSGPEETSTTTEKEDEVTIEPVDNYPVDAEERCAQEGSNGTLVSHDYCNWFYSCVDYQPVPQKCPGNLLFNPELELCDWPERVTCINKTTSGPEETTTTTEKEDEVTVEPVDNYPVDAEERCAQEDSNGTLVSHDYCNWFYSCVDYQPVPQKCPGNLLFNPELELCDWPERVTCINKTTSGPEETTTTTEKEDEVTIEPVDNYPVDAEERCAQEGSNGTLVSHDYCNWFYSCVDYQPVPQKCPGNLLFNPELELCDWPERVTCINKTTSSPEESTATTDKEDEVTIEPVDNYPVDAEERCAQEGSNGILVAHTYCNWFYNCLNNKLVAQKCPDNLLFNPVKEICDWPERVTCVNKTISDSEENTKSSEEDSNKSDEETTDGPINDDPSEAASICAQDGSDGVLVAHENCDEFYICDLYVPVAVRCVEGLLYDPAKKQCGWPENVDCGDRKRPERNDTVNGSEESCNCDPSEAPEICARAGSDGVLIAHENCNQYYKCYAGQPNALSCSGNLLYDAPKGWCDWPNNVDCGDRVVPDNNDNGNDNPAEASDICARAGSDGTLVAHEYCNKFFKCSNRVAVEFECEGTLRFNLLLGLCDWSFNVDCGDRQ